jgi:hypothetical protein
LLLDWPLCGRFFLPFPNISVFPEVLAFFDDAVDCRAALRVTGEVEGGGETEAFRLEVEELRLAIQAEQLKGLVFQRFNALWTIACQI